MKRIFDLFLSFIGIIILLPFYLIISLLILLSGKGGILYKQERVGRNGIIYLKILGGIFMTKKDDINFDYTEEVKKCKTIDDVIGKNSLVQRLIKDVLENILEVEM